MNDGFDEEPMRCWCCLAALPDQNERRAAVEVSASAVDGRDAVRTNNQRGYRERGDAASIQRRKAEVVVPSRNVTRTGGFSRLFEATVAVKVIG